MSLHNPPVLSAEQQSFMSGYLDSLALVERLHRLLLDVIKDEFERLNVLEINAVQALLLFNIGDNEVPRDFSSPADTPLALLFFNIGDNEVTAGELKSRGP